MPALMTRADVFLAEPADISVYSGGAGVFELFGIDFESECTFVLELTHPSGPDGMY
jgi:hypothetical protein